MALVIQVLVGRLELWAVIGHGRSVAGDGDFGWSLVGGLTPEDRRPVPLGDDFAGGAFRGISCVPGAFTGSCMGMGVRLFFVAPVDPETGSSPIHHGPSGEISVYTIRACPCMALATPSFAVIHRPPC